MKKFLGLIGIIAFVTVIGFSMLACDEEEEESSALAGTTWECTRSGSTVTMTFTASTVRAESSVGKVVTGTYTFDGKTGTITWDNGTRESFTVNGNQLTISGYTFTKVSGGGTGGGTTGGSGSGGGTLTLTDIPSKYNGLGASFTAHIYSDDSILNLDGHSQISNGRAIIPITWFSDDGTVHREGKYSGNDTLDVIIKISSTNYYHGDLYYESITFSKGSATVSWNNATNTVFY